jgi:RimJ/RimL family protein N-acetyltransferase
MTETEKFRTERLVARSWQIEDLPLAMELWGDPAVTALIDSRGKLTNAQVGDKLRAKIEWERSGGVQYWVLFDHRNGELVGCGGLRPWLYTPGEANFEVGFHRVKRCWGQGLRNGSSVRRAPIRLGKIAAVAGLRRASPSQSCLGENPQKARIRVH